MLHAIATPFTLFQQQTGRLRSQMPVWLNGDRDAIHDACLATRRIRELLRLTHEWHRPRVADDLDARFKRLGRSLGLVRDADVRIELLQYLASTNPDTAPAVGLMRQRQEHGRLLLMRALVKRAECLGLEDTLAQLASPVLWRDERYWVARTDAWRNQVRHLVAERAHAASAAIAQTTGLYFPNRSHEAHIAIRKCRYALEIATQTGVMNDEPLMCDLKETQDVLGDLQDRQALIDALTGTVVADAGISESQKRLVAEVAAAEIRDLHRQFLARRARVFGSCERVQRQVEQAGFPVAALAWRVVETPLSSAVKVS